MKQEALEQKLLAALMSELELEENRIERLKSLFRDPNFHQEMDEAILSLWQAREYVQEHLEQMSF